MGINDHAASIFAPPQQRTRSCCSDHLVVSVGAINVQYAETPLRDDIHRRGSTRHPATDRPVTSARYECAPGKRDGPDIALVADPLTLGNEKVAWRPQPDGCVRTCRRQQFLIHTYSDAVNLAIVRRVRWIDVG